MRPSSILLLAVCTAVQLDVGCGGSSGECPAGQIWQGDLYGPGSCRDESRCRSWSIWIAPGWAGPGEPHLEIDLSQTPAVAEVAVGSRVEAGVDFTGTDPPGCADGVLASRESWRTSDAAVLRVDETRLHSATFLAVGPGQARLFADGLNQPGGRAGSVELTVCSDAPTYSRSCSRTPLVIRVVP